MALSKIDIANMVTGATPVTNGGTGQTTLAAAGLGKRPNKSPLIINGDMAVAQRATSATGKTTGDIYTVDRMALLLDAQGTYTVAQESLTSGNAFANGFANAWRVDCTTADASPAASDQLGLQYTFEGQDLQVFKKGTANAEKFTLAFWVKSNKTGTGNIQLKDKDNSNRQCTQSYTISSADTWEHKVCVFGADTTGAFGDDNAKSLIINWYLGSGTDSSSGTANHGTWEAQDQTKVNDGGTLNINASTDNDWAITGIQLEVGEFTSATLPPFEHEVFTDNLKRCQRYFETTFDYGTAIGTSTSVGMIRSGGNQGGRTSGRMGHSHTYHTLKRAVPTVTFYDNSGNSGACARIDQGSGTGSNKNMGVATGARTNVQVTSTGDSTADVMAYHFTAVAEL